MPLNQVAQARQEAPILTQTRLSSAVPSRLCVRLRTSSGTRGSAAAQRRDTRAQGSMSAGDPGAGTRGPAPAPPTPRPLSGLRCALPLPGDGRGRGGGAGAEGPPGGSARPQPEPVSMSAEGGGGDGGRRAVQDELEEAVAAHAARERTAEYSDDFESDEDGILSGTEEELNESNSCAGSTIKSIVVENPLSDDDTSQKIADLEDEAADDLTSSFHEKKQMLLDGEIAQGDRKEECLENQNEGDDRKNNQERPAAEEVPYDKSDQYNNLSIYESEKKANQEVDKPIPELQVPGTRNASASAQDQKISTSDLKLEDNSTKSSSAMEVMMSTVYEKRKKLEKSADDSLDEMVKKAEGQIVTDTIQEVSENEESKNTSEKPSETKESVLQSPRTFLPDRTLPSGDLKKKTKSVPSAAPVSSQYLGTLKVLEDKCVQKNTTEFEKADSLRAAVYQNWLEKKKVFLKELKRNEQKKAENLKSNTEKKDAVKREEAIASFEAWKKKKGREAKKLNEKKRLEELQRKKAAEQNEEKTEAAQKAFEKWKERKMEYLREKNRKEKQSERIRKKKEEELIAEKKRDSLSAVEKWNEKKEEFVKQKKEEKIRERKKQEMQQAEKEEKSKKALEEYEKWLEKKERREQLEKKKKKKLQAVHGDEGSSPWSPPGKVTYSMNY
ncbi:microtubule-associated protein 9 [Heliangelus exortis]|uniref:microtubule-associated protein 9 n=1 Tax=Heliangelus exortis TaxID=472823 RepID=UPI003A90957F